MADSHAKTIQIFLPTGEPRAIRVAELTTRIVQAVLIPRSDLAEAKKRGELDHVAIYMLFGELEEQAKPIVYIGQTEDVRKRLDSHNSTKDFWRTAVLGISKTHSFTQVHIRYLEWYCIEKAKEVGRFALNNDQIPSKPFVTEPIEADLLDAFETLRTLVSTLGFPVFEPIVKQKSSGHFFLKGKDAEATGELVEDGFVVHEGATARIEIVRSALQTVSSMRSKLIESDVLIEQNGDLKFTQDYLFNTPSGAAAVVLGRTANGWIEWKDKNGNSLNDVKRTEPIDDEATSS